MDVGLMRRQSRINLKSAWISAPAPLRAGQARLILGAEPTPQQARSLAAWPRSLTRPSCHPHPTGHCHTNQCWSNRLVGIYTAEPQRRQKPR